MRLPLSVLGATLVLLAWIPQASATTNANGTIQFLGNACLVDPYVPILRPELVMHSRLMVVDYDHNLVQANEDVLATRTEEHPGVSGSATNLVSRLTKWFEAAN